MLEPNGVGLHLQGRTYPLRATPQAVGTPAVWLLGSSDYSAKLAAALGLPYVFAHHFSGSGTAEALALYRSTFSPSEVGDEPRTFLTVNVAVADTADEARRLARPQQLAMVSLRTGGELRPQLTVEEAESVELSPEHEALAASMLARWVVDEPQAAAVRIRELATQFGVDEVMIHPVAGASESDPADRTTARERTVKLLVGALEPARA